MSEFANPPDYYQGRINTFSNTLAALYKKKKLFGWLRLITFLAGVFLLWLSWSYSIYAVMAIILVTIVIFLMLVSEDASNQEAIDHQENLVHINKQELLYLNHQFTHHKDGTEFYHDDHPYAGDLDIFGRASVYQFINRTNSEQGNELFAKWLSFPASAEVIQKRQKAVQELAHKAKWRQELQAITSESPVTIYAEKTIEQWLEEKNQFIHHTIWQILRYIIPFLAISTVVSYILDLITYPQFMLALLIFFVIAFSITRKVYPLYSKLNKIAKEIDTLARSIAFIERTDMHNQFLTELKNELGVGITTASHSIHKLNRIFNRFDYRLNPLVYIPLNTLLLWDLQQVLQLEKWKEENNKKIDHWFHTLAEFEALSSLGTLAFNHPGWTFPELNTEQPEFTAKGLGHPLIDPKKSVVNSYSTIGKAQISIITGSNMAGKSTFLRSVGVNMVLACMGAPVNASHMKISPLKVMSSMRVKDNLEESTSTFYAELKKLKSIIDAVKRKEPVFILLDEILRGTNSHDRHTGSKALIRQLVHEEATGIIATHDLELASLENEFPASIHNFHFDVQIDGPELYFDYTLKKGICQSFNAAILMKKIGIEL
jgi:ABC-type multidrug transport system fused ATPase/permease subunit